MVTKNAHRPSVRIRRTERPIWSGRAASTPYSQSRPCESVTSIFRIRRLQVHIVVGIGAEDGYLPFMQPRRARRVQSRRRPISVLAASAVAHEQVVGLADRHAMHFLGRLEVGRHDRRAEQKRPTVQLAMSSKTPRPTIPTAATCSMPNFSAPRSVTSLIG